MVFPCMFNKFGFYDDYGDESVLGMAFDGISFFFSFLFYTILLSYRKSLLHSVIMILSL